MTDHLPPRRAGKASKPVRLGRAGAGTRLLGGPPSENDADSDNGAFFSDNTSEERKREIAAGATPGSLGSVESARSVASPSEEGPMVIEFGV